MSGKAIIPLALAGGAVALFFATKKSSAEEAAAKKKKKKKEEKWGDVPDLDPIDWQQLAPGDGADAKMVFDAECNQITNKLNMREHNSWLTNRYFQLLSEGAESLEEVTIQLLRDQSEHCPWDDPDQWTSLMKALYAQLFEAVKAWHDQTKGKFPEA